MVLLSFAAKIVNSTGLVTGVKMDERKETSEVEVDGESM
jgi:hypothetical protein